MKSHFYPLFCIRHSVRDRSLIAGWGTTKREGRATQVLPLQKKKKKRRGGGGEKSFGHAKGGWGGGAQKF